MTYKFEDNAPIQTTQEFDENLRVACTAIRALRDASRGCTINGVAEAVASLRFEVATLVENMPCSNDYLSYVQQQISVAEHADLSC